MIGLLHNTYRWLFIALIPVFAMAVQPVRYDRDTPQTFDDLFQQALKYNGTYRSTWEEQILAKYTLYRAWGNFLPNLNGNASFSNHTNNSTEGSFSNGIYYPPNKSSSSSSSYGLSSTLEIWDGGARYGTLDNARIAVKAAPVTLTQAELQLAYNLRQSLNTAFASAEVLKAARSSLSLKQETLRLADAKYKLGATTEIDVLSAQVQVNTAQSNLLQATQDSTIARAKLNQVMGVAITSNYPLAPLTEHGYELPPIDSVTSVAMTHSPSSLLALYDNEKAYNDLRVARATWWPTVNLTESYNISNQSNLVNKWSLAEDDKAGTLALTINYPFFLGFQNAQTREVARVTKKQADWAYSDKMLAIEESVRENYSSLVRSKEQLTTDSSSVELATRQRQLEQERYRVGSSTLLNVQNAQDAELNSQIQLIQEELNERAARALLEYTIGNKLPEK